MNNSFYVRNQAAFERARLADLAEQARCQAARDAFGAMMRNATVTCGTGSGLARDNVKSVQDAAIRRRGR